MNRRTIILLFTLGCSLASGAPMAFAGAGTGDQNLKPLPLELPPPTVRGTPRELPSGPGIEPLTGKPRPPFLAAAGVTNVALGKTVTASINPFIGTLEQVTDGRKAPEDVDTMEMRRGTQYVQVDLGVEHEIAAILIWHDHRIVQIMRDVVVQVSNDPEFPPEKTSTLFNNDTDNTSGRGAGTDREYFETFEGKLIDAKGAKARYVRSYVRGSSMSPLNCWTEIEVYGLPAQ